MPMYTVCRQTDKFTTEHQENYQRREFDPIQAKKQVRVSAKSVHSSKKATQRKSKKVIESELVPPPGSVSDKENSHCSNSLPGISLETFNNIIIFSNYRCCK